MNAIQEELAAFPEFLGLVLDPNNNHQVLQAVIAMIEARVGDYSLDTGTANNYVIALNPAITAYTGNFFFSFKALNGNNGASTINFGAGAVALNNDVGSALADGDITAGMIVSGNFSLADNQARITSMVKSQADALYAVPFIYIRAEYPANTSEGALTAGAWQTRVLNTKVVDSHSLATLAANQITLPAGTYEFDASAPAYSVNNHMLKLSNITDSIDYLGQIGAAASSVSGISISACCGRFTISSPKTFELRHRCTTTGANGLGIPCNFGVNEIYAQIKIWKRG
ncbi:MAG: hypothetical protein WC825_12985, partial [Gallionellaceae bacterium]|jgi:hypothetical protein